MGAWPKGLLAPRTGVRCAQAVSASGRHADDVPLDDPRLSPGTMKAGRLQGYVLGQLLRHEVAGHLPRTVRLVFYELEQAGLASKVHAGARRPDQDLTDAATELHRRGIVPWD